MEMRWRLQAASFEHWYFRTCELATTHCQRLSYKLRSRKKSNEACTLGISVVFLSVRKAGSIALLFVLWHQLGIVYTKRDVRFGSDLEIILNDYLIEFIRFFGCLRFLYDIIIYICGKCHRYVSTDILETKGFVWKRQRWSLLGLCGFWIVYSGFRTLGSRVLGFGFWIWRFGHLLLLLLKRQPCRKVG